MLANLLYKLVQAILSTSIEIYLFLEEWGGEFIFEMISFMTSHNLIFKKKYLTKSSVEMHCGTINWHGAALFLECNSFVSVVNIKESVNLKQNMRQEQISSTVHWSLLMNCNEKDPNSLQSWPHTNHLDLTQKVFNELNWMLLLDINNNFWSERCACASGQHLGGHS